MNAWPRGEWLRVDLRAQRLYRQRGDAPLASYPVSTAARGAGEAQGSGCTPRGWHRVRIRIGAGCPAGTVFVARRPTGERWSPELAARYPERDWILTRILWLGGSEPGRNRGGQVDTLRRFIYLHGTPPTEPLGEPRSHGCIRMADAALLEVFDAVRAGTKVWIHE